MEGIYNFYQIDDYYLNGFIKIIIEQIYQKNFKNMKCIFFFGEFKW